ncbi:hypothetical protein [Phenylobacterium sp.]|uniref:hypothetical protein n=1 Tax=Phenylobacterium sp. TaxID=1871053 RepID=UPI003569A2AE
MNIFRLMTIADYAFMFAGVGIALLMIAMGGSEERRQSDRLGSPNAEVPPESAIGRRRRR